MFRAVGRCSMVLALFLALGGHWSALQGVAWTSMLISNASHSSLLEAVKQTFDGDHPCELCKRISAAQSQKKQEPSAPLTAKPDLFCAVRAIVIIPPQADFTFAAHVLRGSTITEPPPLPPPRAGLA